LTKALTEGFQLSRLQIAVLKKIGEKLKVAETKVGIEDMAIYIPPYYVTAEDLARKRAQEKEIPVEKLLNKFRNLKIEKLSAFYQTDVIKASTEALLELIRRNNLKAKEISRIYTATESSIDETKPLGTFLIGELERHGYNLGHIETRESKFACLAGSYDLEDCCNYVALHPDRKAIVICVDEAKYDLRSAAECTQGAGSIAILVKANPSLVTLDFNNVGVFTKDVKDFYRPPGKETPIIDGWLSIYSYLKAMREAFDDFKRKTGEEKILDKLAWLLFHNPYGLMVEDFLSYLLIHEHRDTEIWPEILKKINMEEPIKSGVEAYRDKTTRRQHSEFRKRFRETDLFQSFFKEKVEPSVLASRQTGNLYTASLFLQLASLTTYGKPKKGDAINFWGFGAGCGSLFYCGTFQNPSEFNLEEKLRERNKLTIEEYEFWRNQGSK